MPATKFRDLPLADRGRAWDRSAADARVRAWAGGPRKESMDWARYQRAFVWFDPDNREAFGGYKLMFADIVDDELRAVPRAVTAAAAVLRGARGGVNIPEGDRPPVEAHLTKYYEKMAEEFDDDAIESPFAAFDAPEAGLIRLQTALPEETRVREAPGGGWLFDGLAQEYGAVNDHLFFFFPGSGRKTIAERANRGRVKIEDGHPFDAAVSSTIGKVAQASEGPEGAGYTGFISSVHPDIATKIDEGVIDENSAVINIIQAEPGFLVDIEAVPEHVREWVRVNRDGRAMVTGIREWRWSRHGLVSASSQDRPAIFSSPLIVADPMAPLSATLEWSEESAARLSSWARDLAPKLRRGHLAMWHDQQGREVYCGQIATLDDDNHLVVSRAALVPALEDLESRIGESGLGDEQREETLRAADRLVAQYLRRCRGPSYRPDQLTQDPGPVIQAEDMGASQEAEGEPAATAEPVEIIAGDAAEDGAEAEENARPVDVAEPATEPLTAGEDAANAAADLQLRVLESRLKLLKHRLGVAHEPASTGGGLPAESRPGA